MRSTSVEGTELRRMEHENRKETISGQCQLYHRHGPRNGEVYGQPRLCPLLNLCNRKRPVKVKTPK